MLRIIEKKKGKFQTRSPVTADINIVHITGSLTGTIPSVVLP